MGGTDTACPCGRRCSKLLLFGRLSSQAINLSAPLMRPNERKWCVCKGDELEMHLLPFIFFKEVSAEAQMFPEKASPYLGGQHISSTKEKVLKFSKIAFD